MTNNYNTSFANYLKFREVSIDLSILEEKYSLKLPPKFKSFVQNFEGVLGDVYLNWHGDLQTFSYCKYYAHKLDNEDLQFTGFMQIEEVFESFTSSDSWIENGLIPISEHDHGGCILVGIREENQDKLYFEYSNGIEYIEVDIFSFIKNLSLEMEYKENLNDVYKNWGEKFWRLREKN